MKQRESNTANTDRLARDMMVPASSMPAWLDAVTRSASTFIEGSIGAAGRLFDAREGKTIGGYAVHTHAAAAHAMLTHHQTRSRHRIDFLERGWRAADAIDRAAKDAYLASLRRRSREAGLHDMWHITVDDGHGTWATLGFLIGDAPASPPSARTVGSLRRHLRLALRAQTGMARLGADLIEATKRGPRRDVSEVSREATRAAIRRLEAEPMAGGVSPLHEDRALEIWWGVLEGRWQLLDEHDHAGRRYALARELDDEEESVPRLTRRQAQVAALAADGHSDKGIASLLDLERSTVASHLTEALDRLALPSRVALARAFKASHAGGRGELDELAPVPLFPGRPRRIDGASVIVTFDLDPGVNAALSLVLATLTEAQRPIVRLALAGYGDAHIAMTIGRSRHTVSNQLRRAYGRLGVSTRTELCTKIGELVARASVAGTPA